MVVAVDRTARASSGTLASASASSSTAAPRPTASARGGASATRFATRRVRTHGTSRERLLAGSGRQGVMHVRCSRSELCQRFGEPPMCPGVRVGPAARPRARSSGLPRRAQAVQPVTESGTMPCRTASAATPSRCLPSMPASGGTRSKCTRSVRWRLISTPGVAPARRDGTASGSAGAPDGTSCSPGRLPRARR